MSSQNSVAGDVGQLRRRRLAERLGRAVDEDVDAAEAPPWPSATSARTDASSPVSTVIGTTRRPVAAAISSAVSSSADAVRGGDDDVAALGRQRPRDGLADALAATRHDRPLAGQLEVHAQQARAPATAATVTRR